MTRFNFAAEAEKLNPLIPHTAEIIVGAIAFSLLFFVLRSKVVPMFEKAFTARTEAIQGGIERAEKAQLEAQRALSQYNEQLSKAREEAQTLREEARVQGVSIVEELRAKAQEEAARITAAAHASIEAERQQVFVLLREPLKAARCTGKARVALRAVLFQRALFHLELPQCVQ